MTRRYGTGTLILGAGAVLLALALLGAALLPIVGCPRIYGVSGDSGFHELMRNLKRVTHDLEPCSVCGGRGRVTLLRRWLWRENAASPP